MRRIIFSLFTTSLVLTGCISLPVGLHVHETMDGCTSDGHCTPAMAYYWAPTHEIVTAPDLPLKFLAHEVCHAHQQQEVQDELHKDVSIDLHEWYQTAEYRAFHAVVDAVGYPTAWQLSAHTDLELFAEACSRYLTRHTGWFPSNPTYDTFMSSRGF